MRILATLSALLISKSYSFVTNSNLKPETKSFNYVGDIAPLGYFDPIQISSELTEPKIKYLREAELHHGRVAMLSFLSLLAIDTLQDKLAINYLYSLNFNEQYPFWFGIGCYEFARMGAGWVNPFMESDAFFTLEKEYQPGNLFKLKNETYSEKMLNIELSNGRLAMFGCLGYLAQELVQQDKIF